MQKATGRTTASKICHERKQWRPPSVGPPLSILPCLVLPFRTPLSSPPVFLCRTSPRRPPLRGRRWRGHNTTLSASGAPPPAPPRACNALTGPTLVRGCRYPPVTSPCDVAHAEEEHCWVRGTGAFAVVHTENKVTGENVFPRIFLLLWYDRGRFSRDTLVYLLRNSTSIRALQTSFECAKEPDSMVEVSMGGFYKTDDTDSVSQVVVAVNGSMSLFWRGFTL